MAYKLAEGGARVLDIGCGNGYMLFRLIDKYNELYGIDQAATFWRRKIFFEVGMLDKELHYGMDYDWWLRFAKHEARFTHLPQVLANYRFHKLSKTARAGHLAAQESINAKTRVF